jgi:hypothetical protein
VLVSYTIEISLLKKAKEETGTRACSNAKFFLPNKKNLSLVAMVELSDFNGLG